MIVHDRTIVTTMSSSILLELSRFARLELDLVLGHGAFALHEPEIAIRIRLVDLVAMSEVPHPIPFRTRSLSPPEPMVLRLKARESRSPPGLPNG